MFETPARRRRLVAGSFPFLLWLPILIVLAAANCAPAGAQLRTRPQFEQLMHHRPLVDPAPADTQRGLRIRPMAVHRASSPTCKSPSLTYYGGPVVSNVQVVVVYWNYGVSSDAQSKLPKFYQGAVDSVYFDLLSEYSTNVTPSGGQGGTNQSIGRGSYLGAYTLKPGECADPTVKNCNLTDSQLQAELAAQITSGVLPAPEYDSTGNANTLYMVYFPPDLTLIAPDDSGTSCEQFCAYHGTGTYNSNPLLYGAIMDTYTTACAEGCGSSPDPFGNLTYDSSHEMAEAVTDADIGLDTQAVYADPAAWGSNSCGEIADICDDGNGDAVSTPEGSYVVTELWSNKDNKCVSTGLHPSFSITPPAQATAGEPFNFTLTAMNPSGGLGTDTSFVGTVHFISSDSKATLPADFTFTPGDEGTASFQATLEASGGPTITATDSVNSAITVSETVSVTPSVQVSVGTSPTGLSFSVDGTAYTSAQTLTWVVGSTHTLLTSTPQLPSAGVQDTFTGWSDGGAISHQVTANASTTSYTAGFSTAYLLTTAASPAQGGSVAPQSGTYYPSGTVVPLNATPNSGYNFTGWSGPVANPSTASTTVTMSGPETVTANFAAAAESVTVATSPAGLLVSVDGGVALNSPLNLQWQAGSQHTIAAVTPQTTSGGVQYNWTAWSDAGAVSHSVTTPASATTYTASFSTSYLLTTGVNPPGAGTVTPVSGSYYAANSSVGLTAAAAANYVFSQWAGGVASANSASTTILMSAPASVTANFVAVVPSTTTLVSSANPSVAGEAVTVTASIGSGGKQGLGGSVLFRIAGGAERSVPLVGGAASWTLPVLAPGSYSISAAYSGDATDKPSTSATLKQVVEKDASTTSLAASPNPATYGQAVKLTAAVKSSGKPAGMVTFLDGTEVLGSANVTAGVAALTTSALAAATHEITAEFSGSATVKASSSAELKLRVAKAATTTALTSSKNPATAGQPVTFTATVTSKAGRPAGTVTFKQGASTLGSATLSAGTAALKTSKLPKGSDKITASYAGAADYKPSTGTIEQVVK